jgi:hypothetical protein
VTSKIIAFTIKKNHTGSIHFPNLLYPSSVGKFEGQNMLDLQTKSAINSDILKVQHQATNQASQITDTKHLS